MFPSLWSTDSLPPLAPAKVSGALTCTEAGQTVVGVHQTVSADIPQAPVGISFKFFPGRFSDRGVIVLEPDLSGLVIDIGPVVSSVCLSFVNKNSMQAIRHLQIRRCVPALDSAEYLTTFR